MHNEAKRRAEGPAVDNRSVVDMEQLKLFILNQNKELQETINKKLQETIDNNNKESIQSVEKILKEKLDQFAGYVDSKIEHVRADCMATVKGLSEEVTDRIRKLNDDVEDRLDYLERQSKLTNVVVKNIPYRQDESLENFVNNICYAIDFKNTNSIKSAFRLSNNRNRSNPIIMKFYDMADRREFMFAYFQHQHLNLKDLGFATAQRVVICEALTHKNNEIFKKAMELKFRKVFSSVSTRNGFVYYRLHQKSRPSKISSISSLNTFYSTGASNNKNGTEGQNANQNDVVHTPTKIQSVQQHSEPSNTLVYADETANSGQLDRSMVTDSSPVTDRTNIKEC